MTKYYIDSTGLIYEFESSDSNIIRLRCLSINFKFIKSGFSIGIPKRDFQSFLPISHQRFSAIVRNYNWIKKGCYRTSDSYCRVIKRINEKMYLCECIMKCDNEYCISTQRVCYDRLHYKIIPKEYNSIKKLLEI